MLKVLPANLNRIIIKKIMLCLTEIVEHSIYGLWGRIYN